MNCTKCGEKLLTNYNFCHKCGEKTKKNYEKETSKVGVVKINYQKKRALVVGFFCLVLVYL